MAYKALCSPTHVSSLSPQLTLTLHSSKSPDMLTLLLQHFRQIVTSGPLHLLSLLPEMLILPDTYSPHLLQIFAQICYKYLSSEYFPNHFTL